MKDLYERLNNIIILSKAKFSVFKDYLVKSNRYIAEINVPYEEIKESFHKYLNDSSNYRTTSESKLSGNHYYLSEDKECSLIRSIFHGVPSRLEWRISQVEPAKSLIDIRFGFHRKLIKQLLIFAFLFAFIKAICFVEYNFETVIAKRLSHYPVEIFCTYLSGIVTMFFIYLVIPYKEFTDNLLIEFSKKCLKQKHLKIEAVRNYPKIISLWFILLYGFLTFVDIDYSNANSSVYTDSAIFYLIAGIILFFCVSIIVMTRLSLKKRISVFNLKISVLIIHFMIIFGFIIVFALFPSTLKELTVNLVRFDEIIQNRYDIHIIDVLSHPDQYSFAYPGRMWRDICRIASLYLPVYLFMVLVSFAIIAFVGSFSTAIGPNKEINEDLNKRFKENISQKHLGIITSLRLSAISTFFVWCIYITTSFILWYCVYTNASVILAVLFPKITVLHFGYGKSFINELNISINILLKGQYYKYSLPLRIAILFPSMHFIIFLYSNIYYGVISILKYRHMRSITGYIPLISNKIANQMGVGNVCCVLSKNTSSYSPSARISGVINKRNLLIFTEESLWFLRTYREYTEAILAHEIAHIKYDCKRIRSYGILSRLGLMGSGFLSVLIDSIAIEDRADDEARKYLKDNGKNVNRLKDAAYQINAYEGIKEITGTIIPPLSFSATSELKVSKKNKKQGFLSKIIDYFRIAYKFYFNTEMYYYLHREAKYR